MGNGQQPHNPAFCPYCGDEFPGIEELIVHLDKAHDLPATIRNQYR